jgi:acyl-CoA thioester hydrolase
MAGIPVYRSPVRAEWIDYNGHLRDAYYTLIVSEATDALMDRVGLDARYRAATGGTLYTVEMHLHYLREVKQGDALNVGLRIVGVDHKRIHAVFELVRTSDGEVAATAEVMLLHVEQHADQVTTAPFPAAVSAALAQLHAESATLAAVGPGSRRMELRPPSRAS